MSTASLAIAWALAKQPTFVPVVGARKPAQLEEALTALAHPLSASDVVELEAQVPQGAAAGTRYDATPMAHLDSER